MRVRRGVAVDAVDEQGDDGVETTSEMLEEEGSKNFNCDCTTPRGPASKDTDETVERILKNASAGKGVM